MRRAASPTFDLFLFTPDVDLAARAVAAGVAGIVIDWEQDGKHARQLDADTEVNEDTHDDLVRMRAAVEARLLCRINAFGPDTAREIDAAAAAGADEVLLPMVRRADEVESALELADGRVRLGILVETTDAVRGAEEFARLPVARVFVGLNDLAIERGSPSIFAAMVDGTVDRVRAAFDVPFGVAGLTVPNAGDPVPSSLLIGELARLRCDFSVLRRSFRRDTEGRDLAQEVARLHQALAAAFERSDDQLRADRAEFVRCVRETAVGVPLALHG